MRLRLSVRLISMAIEKPEFLWIFEEEVWIRSISEGHAGLSEVWVGSPETLLSPEVWEA